MKTFVAAALLALPLAVLGLEITSPTTGETWNNSGVHTVTWVATADDPSFAGIYLVNNVVVPPQMVDIIANVSTHAESFTFQTILPNGTDYQIQFNFVGNISESGVLAESGKFTIVNGGPEPGTEASPVSETSTPAASTGSAGGSSTPTGSSGATGASATGSGSTSTATGKSSGHATYGSRGFAIALGMIGVGFAAMFITA